MLIKLFGVFAMESTGAHFVETAKGPIDHQKGYLFRVPGSQISREDTSERSTVKTYSWHPWTLDPLHVQLFEKKFEYILAVSEAKKGIWWALWSPVTPIVPAKHIYFASKESLEPKGTVIWDLALVNEGIGTKINYRRIPQIPWLAYLTILMIPSTFLHRPSILFLPNQSSKLLDRNNVILLICPKKHGIKPLAIPRGYPKPAPIVILCNDLLTLRVSVKQVPVVQPKTIAPEAAAAKWLVGTLSQVAVLYG